MEILSKELFCRILPVTWVQPTITSNGTAYVSELAVSSNFDDYAWRAFDGNSSTYIYQYGNEYSTTGTTVMYLKKPVKATRMSVTYGSNSTFSGLKTKTVQVYKNGSWVTLYTHTASNGYGDGEPNTTKNYDFTTDGYYQAYRFVSKTQGSGHWDGCVIKEIKLVGDYEDYV